MSVNNLSKVMTMVNRGVAGGRKKGFNGLLRGDIFSGEQSIIEGPNFITIDGWGDIRFNPTENFKALVECVGAGAGMNSGGYSRGIIEFQRNHDYTIWTGEGGCFNNTSTGNSETRATFGGGGLCGRTRLNSRIISSGGGLSGIFATGEEAITTLHANSLIIAGGAGGGQGQTPNATYATPRASGGGITGANGLNSTKAGGGGGGTQVAGGAVGTSIYYSDGQQPGNMLRGGRAASSVNSRGTGSGGGGGYYGGGAGGGDDRNNTAGGGGGGGSGFIHPTLVVDGVLENIINSEFWLNSPHYNDYSGVGAQRQRLLRAGHGFVTITFL